MSTLKKKLKNGNSVIGPFTRIQDPAAMEILGYAGFDFAIIDLEHGPASINQVENLVRAAHLTNLNPIVRVKDNSQSLIQRALDSGAVGVQVPQVNTFEMAQNSINAAKFYPEGERGVCRFTRSAQYSNIPKQEYFDKENKEKIVVLQIEGKEGVDNIDKILNIENIDVIYIGPYDLSQALGMTGQVENPKVLKVMENITKKAKQKGIAVGGFADNLKSVKRFINMGIQYLNFGIDTGLFYESSKQIYKEIKNEILS